MRCLHKIKGRAGFTLAETLLAILILLLVSGIVATGVPVAKNVYEKVVLSANAQVMLSTAISKLRDELGTAWNVNVNDAADEIVYFSADTGAQSKLKCTPKVSIKITEYVQLSGYNVASESHIADSHDLQYDKLSKMYVACDGVQWEDEGKYKGKVVSFINLSVYHEDIKDHALASIPSLKIHIVSENQNS